MTNDQLLLLAILCVVIGLFLHGRWRHDLVAMAALIACVVAGLVPREEAFFGFGHPAVVTVACVLVLSRGLQLSGAIDLLSQHLVPTNVGPTLSIGALMAVAALLSAFMNNVGALALLMPVAIQMANRLQVPHGRLLMPLAFGSILGGMTTLIGTPPNLIVSGFRNYGDMPGFQMFDFFPVGAAVAGVGILFVVIGGWRLVPGRESGSSLSFDTGSYLTELRIAEDSKAVGQEIGKLDASLDDAEAQIVGLVRNSQRITAPNSRYRLQAGDILIIETEPDCLPGVLATLDLTIKAAVHPPIAESQAEEQILEKILLVELSVARDSDLIGRTALDLGLRTRYGLNMLAISRQGWRSVLRLRSTPIQAGDVLLMQGAPEALKYFTGEFKCIPLAERDIHLPSRKQAYLAGGIMLGAITCTAFGLMPVALSFSSGVLLYGMFRIVPPRQIYEAVDWSVVVLLAAMIPVAGAMTTTGTADMIAALLLKTVGNSDPVIALAVILVLTMTLSDFMNNAATAAVMCPIALGTAAQLGVNNPDSFLMAVAIGSSCAFLTPIGHQNNTLILGPGGFRFGDYWRLGLPLEILIVLVGIPLLQVVWPL